MSPFRSRSLKSRGVVFLLVIACLFSLPALGQPWLGSGTAEDPYRIYDANDMNEIGANPDDWDKHFLLVADINLADYTGTQFNIIGNDVNAFTGVFDGNGHKILNFNNYASIHQVCGGLFGYLSGPDAVVKHLRLIDPNINVRGSYVGLLVGYLEQGMLIGCCVDGGSISRGCGGLVGINCGIVSNCHLNCDVRDEMGGLVGINRGGMITGCSFSGSLSGGQFVGGLVGMNDNQGTIANCYSNATVSGSLVVGGLVGANSAKINKCYAAGPTYGVAIVGGLVAQDAGEVISSFWDIETSGQSTSSGGEPLTTTEMKTRATFTSAGWDFIETWDIGENQTYPFLRTHPAGDINHDDIVNFFDLAILADHWLQSTQ